MRLLNREALALALLMWQVGGAPMRVDAALRSGDLVAIRKNLLQPREYSYSGGRYSNQTFKYRLFVPREIPPGQTCPLIVWFHGYGEGGDDNVAQLRWLELIFTEPQEPERYHFFLFAMQCPNGNREWFQQYASTAASSSDSGDESITIARNIVNDLSIKFPIDKNRIYLAGVSSGASGCWEMAMRNPELFAAILPIASSGGDVKRVGRLIRVPVWSFTSMSDPLQQRQAAQKLVHELAARGGVCEHTEIDNITHDCWTAAFEEYDVLDWLLAQKRGDQVQRMPGSIPLVSRLKKSGLWWKSLIGLGTVLMVGIAVYLEIRRRSTNRVASHPTLSDIARKPDGS